MVLPDVTPIEGPSLATHSGRDENQVLIQLLGWKR